MFFPTPRDPPVFSESFSSLLSTFDVKATPKIPNSPSSHFSAHTPLTSACLFMTSIIDYNSTLLLQAGHVLFGQARMSDKSGDYSAQRVEDSAELPVTLLDLLSNTLVFDNVVSQLPLSSIFALSRTGKPYQSFVKEN